jgi:acyl carrier protein
MTQKEIEKELLHFLKTSILAEKVDLSETDELRSIGVDSFSIVEIILFIERKFGLILPDNQLLPENFKSVESIASLVSKALK